jgi:hypothetical protein
MPFQPITPHLVEVREGSDTDWVERWVVAWDPQTQAIEIADQELAESVPNRKLVLSGDVRRNRLELGQYRGLQRPVGPAE